MVWSHGCCSAQQRLRPRCSSKALKDFSPTEESQGPVLFEPTRRLLPNPTHSYKIYRCPRYHAKGPFRYGNSHPPRDKTKRYLGVSRQVLALFLLLIQRSLSRGRGCIRTRQVLDGCSIKVGGTGAVLLRKTGATLKDGHTAAIKACERQLWWSSESRRHRAVALFRKSLASRWLQARVWIWCPRFNHSFSPILPALGSEVVACALSALFFSTASLLVDDVAFF